MDDIRFSDSGKKISITIDNETQTIPIEKIDKFQTFITLNQSLNTPLKEQIILDASLNYVPYDVVVEDVEYTDDTSANITDIDTTQETNEKGENITVHDWNHGAENNTIQSSPKQVDFNGVVNVTIYNDNQVYYQKDVLFAKGAIKDNIDNSLPIGEYKAVITFAGNKYLQPTTLNIDFNIEKRLAFFIFDHEEYYGYPTESIMVAGKLKDSLTKKIVKNCSVKFDFDGTTYSTKTNDLGNATFGITIPDTSTLHCIDEDNEDIDINDNEAGDPYVDNPEDIEFDDDGNIIEIEEDEEINVPLIEDNYQDTHGEDAAIFYANPQSDDIEDTFVNNYPNVSYSLIVYLDDDSYYIEDVSANIIVNKLPTTTNISQASDVVNNMVTLKGQIMAHYKDFDRNAIYGKITVSFDDTDYTDKVSINKHGEFETLIDFDTVQLSSNKSDIIEPVIYKKNLFQPTITEITADSQVQVGEPMTAIATVHPTNSNNIIQDGMIVFILEADNKEVYRYGSQIDSVGRAVFFFNTSVQKTYQIHARYYGIFGYQKSESDTKTIEVI